MSLFYHHVYEYVFHLTCRSIILSARDERLESEGSLPLWCVLVEPSETLPSSAVNLADLNVAMVSLELRLIMADRAAILTEELTLYLTHAAFELEAYNNISGKALVQQTGRPSLVAGRPHGVIQL